MNKFLKNLILLLILSFAIGEVVVRLTYAVADIPRRTIDVNGIQKYLPDQAGYWKGGKHQWIINKLGWPGELPKSYDNLVAIIGDSYIENFMNPIDCHQSSFLKKEMGEYNFIEASRSGVSFIEAMEISKEMDSLKPIHSLIYLKDEDFNESIIQIKPMSDVTQLNIKTKIIEKGEIKSSGLKNILYTFKILYYLYNRFPGNVLNEENDESKEIMNKLKFHREISELINYIKINYVISNKTLVFQPNSNKLIIEMCQTAGFNIIELNSNNDDSWIFDYDSHWTCYGHERAAKQVKKNLFNILEKKPK